MRKLQLLITISPRLKYSTLFRSRKKITKAAQEHIMSRYWYIIHPHSLLEYYYSFYITLVYILAMITVPVLVVTPSTNFFTGYVDDAEEVVVLETKRIAKKYVMFYFWMDLVSAVPGLTFFAGNTKTGRLFVLRLPKTLALRTRHNPKTPHFQLLRQAGNKNKIPRSDFYNNLHIPDMSQRESDFTLSVHLENMKVYFVDMFSHRETSFIGEPRYALVYLISSITNIFNVSYIMAVIINFIFNQFMPNTNYESMMSQLNVYMAVKKVPQRVQKKIRNYYSYRYRQKHFKEEVLISMLTPNLRTDLKLTWCGKVFEKMDLLKNMPRYVLELLMRHLKAEIYCPNDTIIRVGARGDCMYFLVTGSVTIITANGREVCHLYDGDFFGETALVLKGQRRLASVVAIEYCELFRLDAHDFIRIAKESQELTDRLKAVAQDRRSETNLFEMERMQTMRDNFEVYEEY
ncbi:potassium channel KAT1-like [Ctenocephalides felis]|uniref:potassium channel KAT1-like n=1 Tax=Ctenocephalides felis TaxID=7515 RepID=UPI000E6E2F35|nr:potassium channel KAT1-like [Ctenocephalides felis]